MLEVIKALARFDPSRGVKLNSFVNQRAHGAAIDLIRKQDPLTRGQRRKVESGEASRPIFEDYADRAALTVASPGESPERHAILSETHAWVGFLKRRQAQVLRMELEGGMSPREIGRALGIHESGVSIARSKAIRKIRAALKVAI